MTGSNRRTFIKTAGAGAAVVGAAALVPAATVSVGAAGNPAAARAAGAAAVPAAQGSMVAYIRDAATGEVSVMIEGREVTVTDHELVATLARALHSNSQV